MHSMSYDEKVRLAEIISDARAALAPAPLEPAPADVQLRQLAARTGRLEALLKMLADSAEIVSADDRAR